MHANIRTLITGALKGWLEISVRPAAGRGTWSSTLTTLHWGMIKSTGYAREQTPLHRCPTGILHPALRLPAAAGGDERRGAGVLKRAILSAS